MLIESSTILPIRETDDGLEVFLARRNPALRFLGNYWVFPGGAVDEIDKNSADDFAAQMRAAAVREMEEEVGVLVRADALQSFAHWITPEGSPKRFSTYFYTLLMSVSDSKALMVDGSELIEEQWACARYFLEQHRVGQLPILPPTYISLLRIAQSADYEALLDFGLLHAQDTILPKVAFEDEKLVMLYPGDSGYVSSDATLRKCLHRCVQTSEGWCYRDERA